MNNPNNISVKDIPTNGVHVNDAHVLDYTESLCPLCMKVVESTIIESDGQVYLKKMCPDHGPARVRIWPDAEHYNWMNSFRVPFKAPRFSVESVNGCPLDCGPCSNHLRQPTLVEIEVTQRCNIQCPVCFMAAGEAPPDPTMADLRLMFENIAEQTGTDTSIQLTGGEPTIRQNLFDIIRMGRECGFTAIEVNTNGIAVSRKASYAQSLKDAGASGIYLQFDGFTTEIYETLRGEDLLADKLQAIENCRQAGLQVVLAMTIIDGINADQIGRMVNFAVENLDVVAGLALQPAFTSGRFDVKNSRRLNMGDVAFMLQEQTDGAISAYDLWPLGCSHPLCSCATNLLVDDDEKIIPFTRFITPDQYLKRYNPNSPQGSVFADLIADQGLDVSRSLSLVIMNYMDATTVDLKRLRECSMAVSMEDGRLIPFCSYQLSNLNGKRLYPSWGRQETETYEIPLVAAHV